MPQNLVVGFGLAMVHVDILHAAVVIGTVTAFVSFAGMCSEHSWGELWGDMESSQAELSC